MMKYMREMDGENAGKRVAAAPGEPLYRIRRLYISL